MDQPSDEIRVQHLGPIEWVPILSDDTAINVDPLLSSTPKQLSYTPQFSSFQSSAILRRLNGSSQFSGSQSSGDMDTANLKGTLSIPTPTKQDQSITTGSSNSGVKRKRDESSNKVDFTKSTIPFTWNAPSPTQQAVVQIPSAEQEARCSKCNSPSQVGSLITCISCLTHWHQKCHSPVIGDGTIIPSNFTCASCTTGREQTTKLRGKVSQQRQQEIDRLRQKQLSSLPRGVAPAKPHLVGFGVGQAPHNSRVEYFETMPKTDMLNVLSFCDQLKPNLLVDVLTSVSKRHPDLPMFDSPDWESQLLNPSRPVKASKQDGKPRHGHVLLNKAAKQKQKTTKKILKRTRVIEVITSAPEEDNVNALPPTWARAGEGLYSKLLPETEDRSILVDDNDEESFSHFLVDGAGRQIMEPVSV
ncbi:unnamed protein product [Fusarium graminearum]|uniref:Chromosome 1, complete genome n=3 Tax=Gibberella zeae TaxID=5518 RepID=A0A0E0RMT9_GIBZE|nr:hypothetical protein FG05_00601 [Fusarium graminearum]PCD18476.1 hypothetical protein FGRA07_07113 [Fusarium graminearum]CAF3449873.1 unnamed protein product [Fusarium graminearum]CAF3550071.1 unnamed protein product [Fusarium graminearum]CAF3581124.1 unnamed protein product [Fusarium graminearum]